METRRRSFYLSNFKLPQELLEYHFEIPGSPWKKSQVVICRRSCWPAHLQAGNTDEARSILNETEPQDAEAKMNHLGVLAELSAIEKDLDTLKSLTAELFPKPVLSRHYF